MKRTPTLTFHYDDTIEQGVRISQLLDEEPEPEERAVSEAHRRSRHRDLERVGAELRARERFLLTTHEGPDGDALGSLLGMHQLLDPARQGLGDVPRREGVPAADRVPLPAAARRSSTSRRPTWPTAPSIFLDCGNIDRMPVDFLTRRRQRRHQHRPPPRQHPLRRRQPGRRRRLLHGRDRLRPRRRCSAPRSPRRSPRRSTSA